MQPKQPRIAWSVAGFDPSSGAGITADLLTFAAYNLFGCSAITALTVQSTVGVFGSELVAVEHFRATLERLHDDLPADGIKLGMLGSAEMAQEVARQLERAAGEEQRAKPLVVLDPVLRSSSGRALFPEDRIEELHESLLPWVDWITPNWAEAAVLTGKPVVDAESAVAAAETLLERHPHLRIVVTGGDQAEPEDVLMSLSEPPERFPGVHVATTSTHGTGCAFSSALLAELMQGASPGDAVAGAKRFVEGALRAAPGVGRGRGPMGLLWPLKAPGR